MLPMSQAAYDLRRRAFVAFQLSYPRREGKKLKTKPENKCGEYRKRGGKRIMNVQKIKQYAFALALAVTFIIAPGLSNMSAVQAKDKHEKERKEKKYQKDHDD